MINDITGDSLKSKANNKNYSDNYDRIFGERNGLHKDIINEQDQEPIEAGTTLSTEGEIPLECPEGC